MTKLKQRTKKKPIELPNIPFISYPDNSHDRDLYAQHKMFPSVLALCYCSAQQSQYYCSNLPRSPWPLWHGDVTQIHYREFFLEQTSSSNVHSNLSVSLFFSLSWNKLSWEQISFKCKWGEKNAPQKQETFWVLSGYLVKGKLPCSLRACGSHFHICDQLNENIKNCNHC